MRKQLYYPSCYFWNVTNHYCRAKWTPSYLRSVCFLRVRPTGSSLGQTVPGKWAESHRGCKFQVCVSTVCCPTQCSDIYWSLWGSQLQHSDLKSSVNHHCCYGSILKYQRFSVISVCPLYCFGKTRLVVCVVKFYMSLGCLSLAHRAQKMHQGL